jgi:hypothetical protein
MRVVVMYIAIALLAILAFLGFFSGFSFITSPSGESHGMDTSLLETTPISDFTPVGVFFVFAYGILPVLTIYGLWKLPRWKWTDAFNKWTGQNWAWSDTVAIGVILVVWIVVEVAYIGSPDGFPRMLQIMMALWGIALIGLAMLPRMRSTTKLAA